MVVTGLPATFETCVWHENARLPSMCTMQAPQRPAPQPNLVPVSLSCSRMTHNRGVSAGVSTLTAIPFTVSWKVILLSPFLLHHSHYSPAGHRGPSPQLYVAASVVKRALHRQEAVSRNARV